MNVHRDVSISASVVTHLVTHHSTKPVLWESGPKPPVLDVPLVLPPRDNSADGSYGNGSYTAPAPASIGVCDTADRKRDSGHQPFPHEGPLVRLERSSLIRSAARLASYWSALQEG
jgi:hypothetical protein